MIVQSGIIAFVIRFHSKAISGPPRLRSATIGPHTQPAFSAVNKQACSIDTFQDIISSDVLVMVKGGMGEEGGGIVFNSHFTLQM